MLLVVNAGSSSLKLALFDGASQVASHNVAQIGTGGYEGALDMGFANMGLADMGRAPLTAAAHRVVHGGAGLTRTTPITPQVLAQITAAAALAPLHNPANLAGIAAISARFANLPQFAAFDTAFHATIPPEEYSYAIPATENLRRFGFHGLSYASMVRRLRPNLPRRLLGLHLGNGASLCAILDGRSVATTMGHSPQDGLIMGTRAGTIESAAVLTLARRHGIDVAETLLNRQSGLLALSGSADMRAATPAARAMFTHCVVRHAGAMAALMGGVDALAFSGGIGENDAGLRADIAHALAFLAPFDTHILPAEEEAQIALDVAALS
jgi:acetate kinase